MVLRYGTKALPPQERVQGEQGAPPSQSVVRVEGVATFLKFCHGSNCYTVLLVFII